MSTATTDYRDTHLSPEKGEDYANEFRQSRWLRHCWEQEKQFLNQVISKIHFEQPFKHLDFACGTGRVLSHLQRHAESSVGVDVSESMLNEARKNSFDATWINVDLTRTQDFLPGNFDVITAFRFFPNAQPKLRKEAMMQLAERLAPGGILVFNNHQNWSSTHCRIGRLLRKKWGWKQMKHKAVTELTEAAGLSIFDQHGIGVLPASAARIFVPAVLHRLADRIAKLFGLRESLAQDVIYVCRRKSD